MNVLTIQVESLKTRGRFTIYKGICVYSSWVSSQILRCAVPAVTVDKNWADTGLPRCGWLQGRVPRASFPILAITHLTHRPALPVFPDVAQPHTLRIWSGRPPGLRLLQERYSARWNLTECFSYDREYRKIHLCRQPPSRRCAAIRSRRWCFSWLSRSCNSPASYWVPW